MSTTTSNMNKAFPLLAKQVKLDSISYGSLKTSDNGSKSVYVSHAGSTLVIQTPKMLTTFALSKYNADKDVEVAPDVIEKFNLQLSLRNMDTNKGMSNFHNMLRGLDAIFIADGVENSKQWFKKSYAAEVLSELYSSPITFPKDKETGEITDKFPPTFRITVPVKNGKIICDCVDENDVKLDLNTIERGTQVTAILQCTGLWLAGSKFGCSWKVLKLQVIEQSNALKNFAFRDDADADDADADATVDKKSKFIESSDDENDAAVDDDDDDE